MIRNKDTISLNQWRVERVDWIDGGVNDDLPMRYKISIIPLEELNYPKKPYDLDIVFCAARWSSDYFYRGEKASCVNFIELKKGHFKHNFLIIRFLQLFF